MLLFRVWFSCNPMGCNPPGSSVHGILQARILERMAIPSSRGSSDSGIKPGSLHLLHCRQILSHWAARERSVVIGGCKLKPQWDATSQSLFHSRSIGELDWGCLRMCRTRIHRRLLRNATWHSRFEKQIGDFLKHSIYNATSSKSTQDNEKYMFTQSYVHEWSQQYYF